MSVPHSARQQALSQNPSRHGSSEFHTVWQSQVRCANSVPGTAEKARRELAPYPVSVRNMA
eukprot:3941644-Rhodomonas_salina.7